MACGRCPQAESYPAIVIMGTSGNPDARAAMQHGEHEYPVPCWGAKVLCKDVNRAIEKWNRHNEQHDDHVWVWRMRVVARWERAGGLAAFLD